MPSRFVATQPETERPRDRSSSTKPNVCKRLLRAALDWAEPPVPDFTSNEDSRRHSRREDPRSYRQRRRSRPPDQAPRLYTIVMPADDFMAPPRSYGLPPGPVSEFEPQARRVLNPTNRSETREAGVPAESPVGVSVDLRKLRRIVKMGHEVGAAQEALQAANNDIGKALEMLPDSDEEQESIQEAANVPEQQPRKSYTSVKSSRRSSPPVPHPPDDDGSDSDSDRAPSPPPQRGSRRPAQGYENMQVAPRASGGLHTHAETFAHDALDLDLLSAGASQFRPTPSLMPMVLSPNHLIRQQQDIAKHDLVRANRQHQRDQAENDELARQLAESSLLSRRHQNARVRRDEDAQDAMKKTRLQSLACHHGSTQLMDVALHDYEEDQNQRTQNEQLHRQSRIQEDFQRAQLSTKRETMREKKRKDDRDWEARQREEEDRRWSSMHEQWQDRRLEYARQIEAVNRSAFDATGSWGSRTSTTVFAGRSAGGHLLPGPGNGMTNIDMRSRSSRKGRRSG